MKDNPLIPMLQKAYAAKRDAIGTYQEILAAAGVDAVTQGLAVRMLAAEEEHRCLFEGFLKSLDQ